MIVHIVSQPIKFVKIAYFLTNYFHIFSFCCI